MSRQLQILCFSLIWLGSLSILGKNAMAFNCQSTNLAVARHIANIDREKRLIIDILSRYSGKSVLYGDGQPSHSNPYWTIAAARPDRDPIFWKTETRFRIQRWKGIGMPMIAMDTRLTSLFYPRSWEQWDSKSVETLLDVHSTTRGPSNTRVFHFPVGSSWDNLIFSFHYDKKSKGVVWKVKWGVETDPPTERTFFFPSSKD